MQAGIWQTWMVVDIILLISFERTIYFSPLPYPDSYSSYDNPHYYPIAPTVYRQASISSSQA
jgi:hypothetical protein